MDERWRHYGVNSNTEGEIWHKLNSSVEISGLELTVVAAK